MTTDSLQATGRTNKVLFIASFMTLIAAGIGFAVRGAILKDWGQQFGFTQAELGTISGGGLVGFGVTIIVLSFFADSIGYGKLMLLAFFLHASSAVVTFAATPVYATYGKEGAYWCLTIGLWLFALGNGTCEAVINPLTASLYPNEKTHKLNILHAGWPLGLILGALIVLGYSKAGVPIRWEYKLGVFVIPVLIYGLMMFNRKFPISEASESNIGIGTMIATLFAPILLFLFLLHALVGYVELGTDSWIVNITERVLADGQKALLAFIWTNLVMFTLRFFAGPIVHKISPLGLLFFAALCGTGGLYLLGQDYTNSIWPWIGAVTIFAFGKAFYWPTMLGVVSERFPKAGALALGISGGIGMLSAGYFGSPGIGYSQDLFAVGKITEVSKPTYERYMSRDADGNPNLIGFPVLSKFFPDKLPPVAGMDNGKIKTFEEYEGVRKAEERSAKGEKVDPSDLKTTLDSDVAILQKDKAEGKPVEKALDENLTASKKWWDEQGKPNYSTDKKPMDDAQLYGAKQALLHTALVPAALAIGYLLLILYFAVTGGYKQVHITAAPH